MEEQSEHIGNHIIPPHITEVISGVFDDKDKADALNDKAWRLQGAAPTTALEMARAALSYAEKAMYREGVARGLHNSGSAYFMLSNYNEALRYTQLALNVFQEIGDKRGEAQVYSGIGNIQFRLGNYDSALESHTFALHLFESMGNKFGMAMCYSNIGNCYQMVAQFDEALAYLLKAHALQEETNDKQGIAIASNNIAGVYYKLKHHQTALQYLFQSLEYFKEFHNEFGIAKTLRNIGQNYELLSEYDLALEYQQQSLALTKKLGDKHSYATCLTNIGNVYQRRGDYDMALTCHREALTIYTELNEPHGRAEVFLEIGATERLAGNYGESLAIYAEGIQIAEEIGAKTIQADLLLGASASAEMMGEYKESLRLYVASSKIRDQILNADKQKLIAVMETRLAIEKALKEREIYRLKNVELARTLDELEHKEHSLSIAYKEIEKKQEETAYINKELAKTLDQLTEINNEKNELLGIVAHDLKNYVASIMLLAETQLRYEERFSKKELSELSMKVKKSAQQMLDFIVALLDANSIESGSLTFAIAPIHIYRVVQSVIDRHSVNAERKKISIDFSSIERTIVAMADFERLGQVLDNLLSNAIKYSPSDKIIRISAISHDGSVWVAVQDEGPGLTEEDKQKLFKKYTRLSAKPTGGEHSTGLGLSITKKLVEGMNGRIWCESIYGHGAAFIVELPEATAEKKAPLIFSQG